MTVKEARRELHDGFTDDQRCMVAQIMEAYKDAHVVPYRLGGSEKLLNARDKWRELYEEIK